MAASLAEVLEQMGDGMRFEEKVTSTAAFTGSPNIATFKLATPVPNGYVALVDRISWPLFAGSPADGAIEVADDQDAASPTYRVVKTTANLSEADDLVANAGVRPLAQGMKPGKKPIFKFTSTGATGSPVVVFCGKLVKMVRPVV